MSQAQAYPDLHPELSSHESYYKAEGPLESPQADTIPASSHSLPADLPPLAMFAQSNASTGGASGTFPLYSRSSARSPGPTSGPPRPPSAMSLASDPRGPSSPFGPRPATKQRAFRPTSMGPVSPSSYGSDEDETVRHVYVVHSDGGRDVHIQLPDGGANVIELPPNYTDDSPGAGPSVRRTVSQRSATAAPPASVGMDRAAASEPAAAGTGDATPEGENPMRRPSAAERAGVAYLGLEHVDSGPSGRELSQEELRARAQAAMAEKDPRRLG